MTNLKFQLERVKGTPVSKDEIIADIRRVAELAGTRIVSQKLYLEMGKYDPTTASRRFGSWNQAVKVAGLDVANEFNYSDERLFENLMLLWEHYGRQPRRAELAKPLRRFPKALTIADFGLGRMHLSGSSLMRTLRTYELQAKVKLRAVTNRIVIPRFGCAFG